MVALLEDLQPQHQKSRQSQARQHPPWHRRGTGVPCLKERRTSKEEEKPQSKEKPPRGHLVLKPWRFTIIIIVIIISSSIVLVIIIIIRSSNSSTRSQPLQ